MWTFFLTSSPAPNELSWAGMSSECLSGAGPIQVCNRDPRGSLRPDLSDSKENRRGLLPDLDLEWITLCLAFGPQLPGTQ